MNAKKENATILGFGVAACAACCAGPILGVLAAIGVGSAVGFALIGTIAIIVGTAMTVFVVIRRRRRARVRPSSGSSAPVPVELMGARSRP